MAVIYNLWDVRCYGTILNKFLRNELCQFHYIKNINLLLDYIVVGSDSGRIVILEYIPAKNILEKVHQETFGKSGCRRIVPGQYLAIDPKGRAVMIGKIFDIIFINIADICFAFQPTILKKILAPFFIKRCICIVVQDLPINVI